MPSDIAGIRATKAALRRRVVARRAALDPAARVRAAEAVTSRVLALPELLGARTVAAYAGVGSELPTAALLDALAAREVRVLLPITAEGATLTWAAYEGADALQPSRRGLLEPGGPGQPDLGDVDAVIVPGLAYDEAGHRVGRGGGSYDRVLAARGAGVLAIGIALDDEILDWVPTEDHDQAVEVVVTPTRVLRATP